MGTYEGVFSDDFKVVYIYQPSYNYGVTFHTDNCPNAVNYYAIRPVVYLKADVKKLSGTGTATDPYVIGYGD